MNVSSFAKRPVVDDFVGVSAWSQRIRADIRRVARFNSSVLIIGPTGTGKELVASAIHAHSPRAEQPFVPVNCAAVSPHLFASHMFGHEKGAFTGAHYAAAGCFRTANGGTIFLDEVGELDLELQARLLRVLQERKVVPVGAYHGIPVDVRLVAATNQHLEREIAAGRFRADLLYRLNVVTLSTVPLKRRREDILPLAEHCLKRLANENGLPLVDLAPGAVDWMIQYDWPGNVRQLQNVLERAVIFAEGDVIEQSELERAAFLSEELADDELTELPTDGDACVAARSTGTVAEALDPTGLSAARSPASTWQKLADVERDHIRLTLERTYYNQSAAAELLGVSFRTLARRIKRYGIDVTRSRRGRPRTKRGILPT